MYQVTILDEATVDIDDLVDLLNDSQIVILNSIHRELCHVLRDQATPAMENWDGQSPLVRYEEIKFLASPHYGGLAPTMWHGDLIDLECSLRDKIVHRAMQAWLTRGSPKRFRYTNRAGVA
ncbi:hypothetical protein [Pseudomonas putida]|uniref:hypothetical protein n=1 Tax=Pseudomonas putida TaxID=303 RepID=UPI003570A349